MGAGAATTTGGLLVMTGLTVGGCCFWMAIGGAFFWAKHSSSMALSCSVAFVLGDCNNRMALVNEASKDKDILRYVCW